VLRLSLAVVVFATWACVDTGRTRRPEANQAPLGWVDVRLDTEGRPTVGADGPWWATNLDGVERARGPRLPPDTPVGWSPAGLTLGGRSLGPPPVQLRVGTEDRLSCGGTRYRGGLVLELDGDGDLLVVNRLPVDDYLRGVLPAEMPGRFGLEALKAQAVAARSYALGEVGRQGWLYASTRSQVYGGADAETWLTSRAVDETAGQILAHDGKVIAAWFHSTCGGGTAPAASAFDHPPEGVFERGVVCSDCRDSPTWSWTRRVDEPRVCRAAGLPVAPLESVVAEPMRFPGRPRTVTVRAGGRVATVAARDFRARLSAGRPWEEQLLSTRWARPPRVVDGDLVVDGHGWGHGVGMCQYGAAGYAARGAGYRVILRRYYPGAELARLR